MGSTGDVPLPVEYPHRGLDEVQSAAAVGRDERRGQIARSKRKREQGVPTGEGVRIGVANRNTVDKHLYRRPRQLVGHLGRIEDVDSLHVELGQVGLDEDTGRTLGGHVIGIAGAAVVRGVKDNRIGDRCGEVLDLQIVEVPRTVRVVEEVHTQVILLLADHRDDDLLAVGQRRRSGDEVAQCVDHGDVHVARRVAEQGVDDQFARVVGGDAEEILVRQVVQVQPAKCDHRLGPQHGRLGHRIVRLERVDDDDLAVGSPGDVAGQVLDFDGDRVDAVGQRLDGDFPGAHVVRRHPIAFV